MIHSIIHALEALLAEGRLSSPRIIDQQLEVYHPQRLLLNIHCQLLYLRIRCYLFCIL
jgi:hypothetical protein